MKTKIHALFALLTFLAGLHQAVAQNTVFTYQGLVTDSGTNFTGIGQFEFALVTSTNTSSPATATVAANEPSGGYITGYLVTSGGGGYVTPPAVTVSGGGGTGAAATAVISGGMVTHISVSNPGNGNYTTAPTVTIAPPPPVLLYTSYWNNDGSSGSGEPLSAVSVGVTNGQFTIELGNTALANMSAIAASLFTEPNLQLRIWFSDGLNGFAALSPAQNLTPAPYSAFANAASNLTGTLSATQLSGGVISATLLPGFQGGDNSIGGGQNNTASGGWSTVGGGQNNTCSGLWASIGGGTGNIVNNNYSTVGGGAQNTASGYAATVGGGLNNQATNFYATVPGGDSDLAGGRDSFAAGDGAQALHDGAFVWADSLGAGFASTQSNQFSVRAAGGVRLVTSGAGMTLDGQTVLTTGSSASGLSIRENGTNAPDVIEGSANNSIGGGVYGSTIGGGGGTNVFYIFSAQFITPVPNTIAANDATIGGGCANRIVLGADDATIGGGTDNNASGNSATVGGGTYNNVSGYSATVGGGYGNTASGSGAVVAGGGTDGVYVVGNTASGAASAIGGGGSNQATNNYATVPGGANNTAGGQYSFAAGQQAQALHQGAFVWADSQNTAFNSTANDTFNVRAQGGVNYFVSGGAGLAVNTGAGTLTMFDDNTDAPGLASTGGPNPGHMRFRNALEIWPNAAATTGGALDVRNTAGSATITLTGATGAIACTSLTVNGVSLTSDRSVKDGFTPVSAQAMLDKVAALPITEWNYKSDPGGVRHVGPMAQDFHAAFALNGSDDKHISVIDEGGVALAAIQGLNQKVEDQLKEKDGEIQDLKRSVAELQKIVQALAEKK